MITSGRFCIRPLIRSPKLPILFLTFLFGYATSFVLSTFSLVPAHSSAHIMNNMSALEETLDILPFTVTVDPKVVKEAVISQVAEE